MWNSLFKIQGKAGEPMEEGRREGYSNKRNIGTEYGHGT